MKCLSVRQPWAWLIVQGQKDVENRSWRASYRGPLLIHAPMTFDREGYWRLMDQGLDLPAPDRFDYSGIVGAVRMVGCVLRSDSPWFEGPWGFVFKNPVMLPHRPLSGKRRLFDVVLVDREIRLLRGWRMLPSGRG